MGNANGHGQDGAGAVRGALALVGDNQKRGDQEGSAGGAGADDAAWSRLQQRGATDLVTVIGGLITASAKLRTDLNTAYAELEQVKLQLATKQDISDGFTELKAKVKEIEGTLVSVDAGMTKLLLAQGQEKKELTVETKSDHANFVNTEYDGKCPCCHKTPIIQHSKVDGSVAQFDHFSAPHLNDLVHTWPICTKCHDRKDRGSRTDMAVFRREEANPMFHRYQAKLASWNGNLFNKRRS
jgi:hypothetical protein